MPGEDQERFEDYLELEHFIAELQAGHVAHPPQDLTPTQAHIYRMAILFHTATPGVSEPRPEFAAQLQSRLEEELQAAQDEPRPLLTPVPARATPNKRRVSRRMLLAGGAAVAASVTAGVGIGAGIERMGEQATTTQNGEIRIHGSIVDWSLVTTVAEMGNQAVKFVADNFTGYLVRSDGSNGDPAEQGKFIAMSAACTHMGCIVNWASSDRKFHCPCHGGVFTEDGGIDIGTSSLRYIDRLPRLDVKEENGKIYVRMPAASAS